MNFCIQTRIIDRQPSRFRRAIAIGCAAVTLFASTATLADQILKDSYLELEQRLLLPTDLNGGGSLLGSSPVQNAPGSVYALGFEGPSQYDAASFSRNFIPPDTMGAVGKTQYMATTNGAYAVYDKATGTQLSLKSDVAFWAAAGQTGANGDTRILYNAAAGRWVAVSFGASVSDLQIAVSNTDDATGSWQSVKFTGYAGGVADYPTLALDKNAIYIGTNNFKTGCSPSNPAAQTFCGTTLNVIPINSLFNAGAPSVTNMKQFVTPYVPGSSTNVDRGFAQQGVMGNPLNGTATIVANSAFIGDNLTFKVNGLTADSALGGTLTASTYLGVNPLVDAGAARQPATIAANQRVIDALDQRISSSVYEAQGKIYTVQTVDGGMDYARVRYTITDATTNAILDQGDIGTGTYDYYQGSIAVNANGDVVIGYNRSSLDPTTGKIGFYARTFRTDPVTGKLIPTGQEILLHESLTNDYHNGSLFGQPAAGRQRWGDYSQVSIDPNNSDVFWLIGEFAREYNLPPDHPGGTGFSRWGTWIASIDISSLTATVVPEPATWLLMIFGVGAFGFVRIRQRRSAVFALPA